MFFDANMKKTLAIMFLLFLLSLPLLVSAQAPTPPVVSTLGPVVVCSDGDNINISSPQNGSYTSNRITLDFCVAVGGMFGQFGNVGYSVDGGTVYSVNSFINKPWTSTHLMHQTGTTTRQQPLPL